jgi:hypothetical protein
MSLFRWFQRQTFDADCNIDVRTSVRHLIFHFHCVEHEKTYYAIQQLKRHLNLFDGHKIFTISSTIDTYWETASFKKLMGILKQKPDVYIIPVDNNLERRESIHFFTKAAPLLKTLLLHSSQTNYVFYAHTKGITHPEKNYAITAWVNTLWKYNVECYHDKIKILFDQYSYKFIGCLKSHQQHAKIETSCHYQGTFFWFNANILTHNELWYKNYSHILSLELWPGLVAQSDECGSVFDLPEGDLYRKDYWYNQYFIGKIDKPHTMNYYTS